MEADRSRPWSRTICEAVATLAFKHYFRLVELNYEALQRGISVKP
jgi:hypothetical protein